MHNKYAKLDLYDYRIDTLEFDYIDIVIAITSSTDITIADIASDITASDGYIYVEGRYYKLEVMHVEQTELHIITRPIN